MNLNINPSSTPEKNFMANHSSKTRFSLEKQRPVELALALTTAPVLVALVGARVLASTVQNLGQWSEELFRGDRLPSLPPPTDPANGD